ncbi:thiol-disulfide oxidoreductase DCC family protein [Candidatus Phycosocius spiralis]|uniref:Thiol-disulfide oxidoreductase n=1 Tax=Candidatus Phycosocius spiralis TaxID=2815099 RepID=A0ABQ4PTQ4_9PROT|nr:DUF393 domain-containing protein [Candidatus Phycosocius spiralis]GIU66305.1 thiol-disulfide oxidoreductase [Candidatus Phycosocius spiralis]
MIDDVPSAPITQKVTIWFDGGCPLCLREIGLYRRLDAKAQRIDFVDLAGDAPCPLDRADMLARFHAQEEGKPLVSGAAAFGALWRHVTPLQPLGWLAQVPIILKLLDYLYGQFLRIRPRIQAWFVDHEKR